MFLRTLTAALLAASSVSAWPIAFFPTLDCDSHPVAVLHEPPPPGVCGLFHGPVKSYSGGTADSIQKVLLYYHRDLCHADAAHRMHSNHTINNSTNLCIPFKKPQETPSAFTFIEEFLPINCTWESDTSSSAFRIQL